MLSEASVFLTQIERLRFFAALSMTRPKPFFSNLINTNALVDVTPLWCAGVPTGEKPAMTTSPHQQTSRHLMRLY